MQKFKWYLFFSFWVINWFVLYKFNIVKYNPSISYIFIFIFNMLLLPLFFLYLIYKKNYINYKYLFLKYFAILIIDIIPLILLYPFVFTYKDFIMNLSFLCIYLLFMNRNIIDIIYVYISGTTNITVNEFKKIFKYEK